MVIAASIAATTATMETMVLGIRIKTFIKTEHI